MQIAPSLVNHHLGFPDHANSKDVCQKDMGASCLLHTGIHL